jgi:galactokinase
MGEADLAALKPKGSWVDYVAGVAAALIETGLVLSGADLFIDSDIPIGAGISSSAALEIAVAKALTTLVPFDADGKTMAKWAQRAENRFIGMPSGIMDPFVSANGVAGHALMLDCRSLDAVPLPLPKESALLLLLIMDKQARFKDESRGRRDECAMAARLLGVRALRDVREDHLGAMLPLLPEPLAKRCRHVVTENARVERAADALRCNDIAALGRILNESHQSLRDDMEVSADVVDRLVEIAQGTPGILGARMMGDGFGGCAIAIARADEAEQALAQIVQSYGARTGQEPDALLCQPSSGVSELTL